MAGLAATNEGPIGKNASWLVSARKSYLGTLLHEWGAHYLAVGYTDFQGKLSYRPSSSHQLTLTSMLGSGWVEPGTDSYRFSHIKKGQTSTADMNLGWNWGITPSALLHSQLSYVQQQAWNHDRDNQIPFQSHSHDYSAQQELEIQLPAGHLVGVGWTVRRGYEDLADHYYDLYYTDFFVSANYRHSAWYSSAYLQDSWQLIPGRLQLNFGGRTEHFTQTGQNLWMPRASVALHLTHDDKLTFS